MLPRHWLQASFADAQLHIIKLKWVIDGASLSLISSMPIRSAPISLRNRSKSSTGASLLSILKRSAQEQLM